MSLDCTQFYVDGQWVEPLAGRPCAVVNPATEQAVATIALGGAADVERAVAAARRAFAGYARSTPAERLELLARLLAACKARQEEFAQAISIEMGAPITLARTAQAGSGLAHVAAMIEALPRFAFEETAGSARVVHEPIGVCALITPWNWPLNQIACKVVPALAAGCTMVLKPSEIAPLSAVVWARAMHDAGVPPGVFNLVQGDGPGVGATLAAHPDVDMVSFTGSTRAGSEVARLAAPTIKRVHQELGGKSPNLLLPDADFPRALRVSLRQLYTNSGQSCNAPTRMLVPRARLAEVEELARAAAEAVVVGDPADARTQMGPLVSALQFERVQGYIRAGLEEGARLVAGGPGRPQGLERGWFARPTVFSDVRNDMRIAREEIFGPVLAILPYDDVEQAVAIANDTPYGLSAYLWTADATAARAIAARLRAGMVHVNGAPTDIQAPFGGYRMSGNGREWGLWGLREFLETKAIMGA